VSSEGVSVSEGVDSVVQQHRDRIAALDRQLVEIVNARIREVEALHRHKGDNGLPVRDLERERWLVEHLRETNRGPLSVDGLAELVEFVLALVRQEQARG
jgi:chorismate mutase